MPSPWTTPDPNQVQPDWLNSQCPREGRYVLGPLLGRGGMGDVHEAWDVVLCRTVALKILKDIEPTALIRFMHEAQIHARVVHPNICRIYDVDNYEGTLRVAMQLVRGPNLEQVCRELARKEVVTIMALVAQAVDVVHRLKLVHRDLKPSNILLERNSEGRWTPFVCDFGLAMALDEPALTYSHGVLGTPAYMAPEQFRGDRDQITAATDVFALGGTLHYALTGQPPAGGRLADPGAALLPRDLRAIIGKCLDPDPALRYPSACALGEDLWRYLEGDPVHAVARTALARLGRQGRRGLLLLRPWLLVLAGAGLATAVLLALDSRRQREEFRQMALAQELVLDAVSLELAVSQEQMLAVHDLRPTYARIRELMARDRARLETLGPRWQAQGWFAVGCAAYLVRDYPGALAGLEKAWQGGFRSPVVARQLAGAGIAVAGRPGSPDPELEAIVRQPAGLERDAAEAIDTLGSFLRGEYQVTAAKADAPSLALPCRGSAAALEAACLVALGQQALAAGDLPRALDRHREALAVAGRNLVEYPSHPQLRHAYARAALGLAGIQLDQGQLAPAFLEQLKLTCATALQLDPDDPELLDDSLALQGLRARRRAARGQDPRPELEAVLGRLAASPGAPASPGLQEGAAEAWLLKAQWEAGHGLDPAASLRSAQAALASGECPATASTIALEGLIDLQQSRTAPDGAGQHLARARERLKASLALGFGGRNQARLKRSLRLADGQEALRTD